MTIHRSRTIRALALAGTVVLAGGTLAACSSDDESADTTTTEAESNDTGDDVTEPEIEITDAWARPGTAGGNSAIYMVITGGQEDDALVGAQVPTDVAAETQVHETVPADDTDTSMESDSMGEEGSSTTMAGDNMGDMGDGMMTMKEVDKIDIPAGQEVKLEPGGYHVMLLDLQKDLVAGDEVTVTLTFEKGIEKVVTAEVREP